MEDILVVFIIFGSIGAILWKYLDGRHLERMAMIDKGVKAEDLKGTFPTGRISPLSNLKWGLFFAAIGLGIGVAAYLDKTLYWDEAVYPAMIFLFGGAALITFYGLAKNKVVEK